MFDSEEENEEGGQQSTGEAKENIDHVERISTLVHKGSTIAALTSTPECSVFRVCGTLQGQRVIVMLDSGATLNSINSSLVTKRGLHTKEHEGFKFKVAGGNLLSCTHLVPQLSITMGNYIVTDDFFMIDLDDTYAILGIQWMEILDQYTQSFKRMEFLFKVDGKKVVLRGMSNSCVREISARWMEAIFRHDDIIWESEQIRENQSLQLLEGKQFLGREDCNVPDIIK